MSRRLSEMTEENFESGGKAARKAIEDAGFSEDLKKRLEAKILDSQYKSDNAAALSQASLSPSAGKEIHRTASAQPWTGTETISNASLRMLNDAHKPLRSTSSSSSSAASKAATANLGLDARMRKAIQQQQSSQGQRLANARDRTSMYAVSQDPNLTASEKESLRKQLKERFLPSARPMPGTVQGLAALANERIENAIARGQFKNIPRGKTANTERDHNANSPFLDTTEYFMNKIIQKQEIVPPWIEKQQELVKETERWRGRLRNDWKRYASRVIASEGGTLGEKVRRAEGYARGEERVNPKRGKKERLSQIDGEGRLVGEVVVEENAVGGEDGRWEGGNTTTVVVSEQVPPATPGQAASPLSSPLSNSDPPTTTTSSSPSAPPSSHPQPQSLPQPFRSPSYLLTENPYHTLSITHLNTLTRSYNLLAPQLAQKPYFSLERELLACYADVAPLLAGEIRERATRPASIGGKGGEGEGGGDGDGDGVWGRFTGRGKGARERIKVVEDRRGKYGVREWWREVFGGKEKGKGEKG